jgi:hypothetical protein
VHSPLRHHGQEIPPSAIEQIEKLYEAGQYLRAYQAAIKHAPLKD